MEFNDIQSAWDKEDTGKFVLPVNLEKIKSANTPLNKIRKNLKMELIVQVVFIIFLGFLPLLYKFPTHITTIYYLLFCLFIGICIYYLRKLYQFYNRLNTIALKTKDSLYETYFDIRLNLELYKTFGFALTPIMVLFTVVYLHHEFSQIATIDIANLNDVYVITIYAIVIVSVLLMGLMLELWVNFYYGRYAKEMRKVLDELKEE